MQILIRNLQLLQSNRSAKNKNINNEITNVKLKKQILKLFK